MKSFKHVLISIFISIILMLIIYLVFSFMQWDFNAGHWGAAVRDQCTAWLVTIGILSFIFCLASD